MSQSKNFGKRITVDRVRDAYDQTGYTPYQNGWTRHNRSDDYRNELTFMAWAARAPVKPKFMGKVCALVAVSVAESICTTMPFMELFDLNDSRIAPYLGLSPDYIWV